MSIRLADTVILAVFVVEIAIRLLVHRARFFRDPWSLFDFAVVTIALVPATGPFSVLRALRVLRVLRVLTIVPSMRRVAWCAARRGAGAAVDRPGAGADLLRLRGDRDQPVRPGLPDLVRQSGTLLLLAVPDHDAGELVDGHFAAGDGGVPVRLGVLHSLPS